MSLRNQMFAGAVLLSTLIGNVVAYADDSAPTVARGRMSDAAHADARAVEINGRDVIPSTSERELPNLVFDLYGEQRKLEDAAVEATEPDAPGTAATAGTPRSETQNTRFESGRGELLANYRAELDRIAELVHGRPNLHFNIVGHTDSQRISKPLQKTYPDNQALGLARAKRVGGYLRDKLGLSDGAFQFDSKGETAPIADNGTPEGMARNRRVEVQVFWNDPGTPAQPATPATPRLVAVKDPTECGVLSPLPAANGAAAAAPFAISVDGKPVEDGRARNSADRQRCIDVALERDHLRLQYDNLAQARRLNATVWPLTAKYGDAVQFRGYSNYLPFIRKAEMRIERGDPLHGFAPVAIVPLDVELKGSWTTPEHTALPALHEQPTAAGDLSASDTLFYRLRVYGAKGEFDETQALPLALVEVLRKVEDQPTEEKALFAGFGENRLDVRNIPVDGGTLTVSGEGITTGQRVSALGMNVPVDDHGRFVIQQIVPRTLGTAEIAVEPTQGNARIYRRDFRLPRHDWFFVGIADITVGHNGDSARASEVTGDIKHYNGNSYSDGHLAFYTKGKLDSATTVTASVDTLEEPLSEIFKNFGRKDARSVFRRFDAKDSWPTFGDDSTLVEDAPTQGKAYAKIERDQSSLLWGNFKVAQTETELAQINRGLYGLDARFASAESTSFGVRKLRIEAFAADPGTLGAHDDHRGTGGTLYYLRNQDISRGSERLYVEVRDRDSGFVLSRRSLVVGTDYELDYLQGRVLLSAPLPSTADDSQLVRAGGISGNAVWLVAHYEYTPLSIAGNNAFVGGRISGWITDNVRLGATASGQREQDIKNKLAGIDVMWRKTDNTWFKVEGARTKGFESNQSFSNDGGYFFGQTPQVFDPGKYANAGRVETQADLKDFGMAGGRIGAYAQKRGAGFSGPGQLTDRSSRQVGGILDIPITSNVDVHAKLDVRNENEGYDARDAAADVAVRFNPQWKATIGVRNDKREQDSTFAPLTGPSNSNSVPGIAVVSNAPAKLGTRTDAALQVDYTSKEDWSAYAFGQGTLDTSGNRQDNNRGGVGAKVRFTDRVTGDAEVSGGNGGAGAKAGVAYQYSDNSNAYLSYRADPDRTDEGIRGRNGMVVGGAKSRLNDAVSLSSEYRYQIGEVTGLTQAYGVDLSPFDRWTFGASLEAGKLDSELLSQIDRKAIVLRANYTETDVKYGGALEFRRDETRQDKRRSWLARNNFTWQVDTDGRVLGRLNIGRSNSSEGTIFGTDYTELMAGYAWRPSTNDKWNVLFRYTYLFDLTSPGQQDGVGTSLIDFQQRSHVLALDATYDISSRWTIGGRVAGRKGELRQSRDNSAQWFDSTATLVTLRLDWKVVRNWDWLIEGRQLRATEARDHKSGALTALYYHVSENLKVGGGYNWTDYSDELTNLSYHNRGYFMNFIGMF